MTMRQLVSSFLLCVPWLAPAAGSELPDLGPPAGSERRDLRNLSLEELMDLEIISVTKGEERRLAVPAAVSVITGEDIRRSGATSLPEALRMAPGLHVARSTSSSWAVSSRGFSNVNSAKLLVLIDGRSLYTPLFSGVLWDVQDTLLEDVERIEVIRGPGAALWGANAMNGVINVTTKNARDTHGGLVQVGGGTEERAFGVARYGARLGESFHYRVFAKYLDRDAGLNLSGPDKLQPNVRISWDLSPRQAVWGAASRAVRTPTRLERDVFAPLSNPAGNPRFALVGNRDLDAEELEAFELGYRVEADAVFLDLAVFYNLYDRLVAFGRGEPSVGSDGRTLIPVQSFNAMDGEAHGGEAALEWFPRSRWRVSASYSYLDLHLDASARALSPQAASDIEGASPRHQIALRSVLDLPRGISVDASLRWVDRIETSVSVAGSKATSYSSLDLRLGWSAWEGLSLALVGQNLLQSLHTEFPRGTDVERGVYAKLTWRW